MKVCVEVYASITAMEDGDEPLHEYVMEHDDAAQRRALGARCRCAFEAGQVVLTFPQGAA